MSELGQVLSLLVENQTLEGTQIMGELSKHIRHLRVREEPTEGLLGLGLGRGGWDFPEPVCI